MATDQFCVDAVRHVAQSEAVSLLGDLGMEHHLQQEVSQFFFEVSVVAMANGVCNFVGFL
jgi:hypothetical protein